MTQPIVSVEDGKLKGKLSQNIDCKTFYSFLGIPYAKPPLGKLRFKDPQPCDPWTGIRNATKDGSECYSRDIIFGLIQGSEDCLYLNVYTPELPSDTNKTLKPVMVWIHGGAFISGSNKSDVYGPEYLLTEDVVLVTINYRLGALGFLRLEDASLGIPGNAALKDMVMALKWVQKNISSFCGDPNNVTVFGQSAGGIGTHFLVLSPLAKGLFHKAIVHSCCALNVFAKGRSDVVQHFASELKLDPTNEAEILKRLQELTIFELFTLAEKVAKICDNLNDGGGKLVFGPCFERPCDEAFITEEPIKIIRSGNYNKVPMVFGYTTREGMIMEIVNKPLKPSMPKDFKPLLPHMLEIEQGGEVSQQIADKVKHFYYGTPPKDSFDNYYLLHTDNYCVRDIMFGVKFHVLTSDLPIYLYRVSVETSLNLFKKIGSIRAPGVCHGDDTSYLFKSKLSPPLRPGSLEEISVRRFVRYWTNFAKCGNPNSDNMPPWKSVNKDVLHFVDIGKQVSAGIDPDHERMEFWRGIFTVNPLYSI